MNPHAPRQLPALSTLREAAGQPSASAMSDYLGLAERTVWRYLADDDAPRPVLLSMWFASAYGVSRIACQAQNQAETWRGYAQALKAENDALRADLARVLALADTGAANQPTQRVKPMAAVLPLRG